MNLNHSDRPHRHGRRRAGRCCISCGSVPRLVSSRRSAGVSIKSAGPEVRHAAALFWLRASCVHAGFDFSECARAGVRQAR